MQIYFAIPPNSALHGLLEEFFFLYQRYKISNTLAINLLGNAQHFRTVPKIVQFRASGIRVKLPTFSPALNLVGTQVPILPWIKIPGKDKIGRYMTLKEAAAIQGMRDINFKDETFSLPLSRCYEALGNAVNVDLVRLIAKALITYGI